MPSSKVKARTAIGNGIPAELTRAVVGPIVRTLRQENQERLANGEGIRYSLTKINNEYRVIADRDLFKGLSDTSDKIAVLKNYINQNLRGADITTLIDNREIGIAQKNQTLGKLWRPGQNMSQTKFNARLETVSHYDEVIFGSKQLQPEKNKKPGTHPERAYVEKRSIKIEIPQWDSNDKLIGAQTWEAVLAIPVDINTGKETAYDIAELRQIKNDSHSGLALLQRERGIIDRESFPKIIAEEFDIVNTEITNYSLTAKEIEAEQNAVNPAIYIRGKRFINAIFDGKEESGERIFKTYETRPSNTLDGFIGRRVAVIDTDAHKVVGYVTITDRKTYESSTFHDKDVQKEHWVEQGDKKYDIQEGGTKYGYKLEKPVRLDTPRDVDIAVLHTGKANYIWQDLAYDESGNYTPRDENTSPSGVNRDTALQAYDTASADVKNSVTLEPLSPESQNNPPATITYRSLNNRYYDAVGKDKQTLINDYIQRYGEIAQTGRDKCFIPMLPNHRRICYNNSVKLIIQIGVPL